jgi:biotin synthase
MLNSPDFLKKFCDSALFAGNKNQMLPDAKSSQINLEQFKLKLSKLKNEWDTLKLLWAEAGLEQDPFKTTGKIREIEAEIVPTLVELLNASGEERELLYNSAQNIRDTNPGREIQVRGVIEASNICRENCLYCLMRLDNLQKSNRKRVSAEQIVAQASVAYDSGIKELFIQSGEDKRIVDSVIEAVKKIKSDPELRNLKIIINLGNLEEADYLALAKAGVDGCLIKHETSDKDLHKAMRPGCTLEVRTSCLLSARKSGMYTGTGVIVGLPGQSDESLAEDIIYAGRLGSWNMISCSPFTASDETPLKGSPSGDFYKTLNMIAIFRHLFQNARIPAVSNLDNKLLISRPHDLGICGQSMGINAGANGITINFTPQNMLKNYQIYSDGEKRRIADFSKAQKISKETGLPLDIHKATEGCKPLLKSGRP